MNKILRVLATVFALSATTVAHAQRLPVPAAQSQTPKSLLDRRVFIDVEGALYESPLNQYELWQTCAYVFRGQYQNRPLGRDGTFHVSCEWTGNGQWYKDDQGREFVTPGERFREDFIFRPGRWPEFLNNRFFSMISEIRLYNLTIGTGTTTGEQVLYRRIDELAADWRSVGELAGWPRRSCPLCERRPTVPN